MNETVQKVLIVDDDVAFCTHLSGLLSGPYVVKSIHSPDVFFSSVRSFEPDLVLLDMRLHKAKEGIDLLRSASATFPLLPIVMMSSYGDSESAVAAVRAGARMFLRKEEFSEVWLVRMTEAMLEQARLGQRVAALSAMVRTPVDHIIGTSKEISVVREKLNSLALRRGELVSIFGEPGTGRSLIAQCVSSKLGDIDKCLTIHCNQIDSHSLQRLRSLTNRIFILEDTHRLDHSLDAEFGSLINAVSNTNAVILTGNEPYPDRVSTSPLAHEIRLPPLRHRTQDIPILAHHFLNQFRLEGHTTATTFSASAIFILENHMWPGNIMELRKLVEYAGVMANFKSMTQVSRVLLANLIPLRSMEPDGTESLDHSEYLARAELEALESTLRTSPKNNRSTLAKALKYKHRLTLTRHMQGHFDRFPFLADEYPLTRTLFFKNKKQL